MSQLSELVVQFKDAQNAQTPSKRRGPRSPVGEGEIRGVMGATGSRLLKGRDSLAGARKEYETLNSPIFKAFMSKQTPKTPVSDFLAGRVA